MTKCVLGAASISIWMISGMLSRGVMAPESICRGSSTRIISRLNCGIEPATVARKIPMQVVANRCSAMPAMNSAMDPWIGTSSSPCTTTSSEKPAATSTTSPIAQIFASMISTGATGMTSRCSMVPCSRSRIRAAPLSTMDSMVIASTISVMAPNQPLFSSWLKRARRVSSTGSTVSARWPSRNSSISLVTMD